MISTQANLPLTGSACRSVVAVDIGSVVDPQNLDSVRDVVDAIDDPIRTSMGAVRTLELSLERLADPHGGQRKVAEDKRDDGRNDSRRALGLVNDSNMVPLLSVGLI
jgi:hypothetical protein